MNFFKKAAVICGIGLSNLAVFAEGENFDSATFETAADSFQADVTLMVKTVLPYLGAIAGIALAITAIYLVVRAVRRFLGR